MSVVRYHNEVIISIAIIGLFDISYDILPLSSVKNVANVRSGFPFGFYKVFLGTVIIEIPFIRHKFA